MALNGMDCTTPFKLVAQGRTENSSLNRYKGNNDLQLERISVYYNETGGTRHYTRIKALFYLT